MGASHRRPTILLMTIKPAFAFDVKPAGPSSLGEDAGLIKVDSLVKSLCRSNWNKRTHTWVQYTVSVPYTTPTYGSAQMC